MNLFIPVVITPANDAPTPEDTKPKRQRPPRIPNADVIPRKKRGKKEDDTPKITEPQPAEFFAQQLYGIHQLAALMTGLPVQISEEDSKKLGDAIHGVVKQFDLSWIGKFTPIVNLAVAVTVVEAPVIMRAQAALSEKRAATKPQPFKVPSMVVEDGLPIKDSLTDVPEPPAQTGVFSNLSDMKGVNLKRE